ncbi:MAG: phage integrase SAM-like domain-containing protein [Bacteroidaceae bacterium]|nr:phage integrase SAM-like domain-containing protein [Bacteroidaceae bacterium]
MVNGTETFCEGKCTFGEIDVDLCNKFKEHLYTAPQTIHNLLPFGESCYANSTNAFL